MNRTIKKLVVLSAALLSASAHAQDVDQKSDAARFGEHRQGGKTQTIVISFDGAQPVKIEEMIKSGKLSKDGGFAHMIQKGTQAKGMIAVLPTVTATNHISIATGAYVEKTNIPGNTFHLVDTPLTMTTSGFGTTIEAETLWEAAKRQGKTVSTIAFAGADGRGEDRRGDQTLGFGVRVGFSVIKRMTSEHFDAASANSWNLGSETCEFKKANIGTISDNRVFFQVFATFAPTPVPPADVNVLVCDTNANGQEQYDIAFFDFDKDISNGFIAKMKAGDWAPFALPLTPQEDPAFPDFGRGIIGSWVKLSAFAPDLSAFNLYLGDISHNVGYPQAFVSEIDKTLGFWPAEPDFFNLERGNIEEATYMEQLERLALYLKDAMLLVIDKYKPDLLMGYQVQTDEAGHQFFLVDPRQKDFNDAGKRQRYAGYLEKAYQIADDVLREIIDATDGDRTNIVAVSDHGMAPLHTQAFPNRILRQAELVKVSGNGLVDPATSPTNAVTVGGAANIYINLQGREPTGIVPLEEYESMQDKIVEVFKAVNDPVTNEPVFEIVLKKPLPTDLAQEQSAFDGNKKHKDRDYHVFAEDTGDVMIVSRPGYNLDFNAGTGAAPGDFFQPSTFFGQHGYDPNLAEMKAIFYAVGPDFRRATLHEVNSIDVAPIVADLLRIDAPRDAQGRKLHKHSGR